MGNLNRNRLIGGGVLLLASLLFVPAILTPTEHPLNNPNLPVSTNIPKVIVGTKTPQTTNSSDKESELISLASISETNTHKQLVEEKNITKAEDLLPKPTEKTLVPIKLESTDSSQPDKSLRINNTAKQESWVRVGSFSDLDNADKLALDLRRKKYPVKIENTKISGKPYRRVLLGPFASDDEMRKVLNQVQREGFTPEIQR